MFGKGTGSTMPKTVGKGKTAYKQPFQLNHKPSTSMLLNQGGQDDNGQNQATNPPSESTGAQKRIPANFSHGGHGAVGRFKKAMAGLQKG